MCLWRYHFKWLETCWAGWLADMNNWGTWESTCYRNFKHVHSPPGYWTPSVGTRNHHVKCCETCTQDCHQRPLIFFDLSLIPTPTLTIPPNSALLTNPHMSSEYHMLQHQSDEHVRHLKKPLQANYTDKWFRGSLHHLWILEKFVISKTKTKTACPALPAV